MPNITKARLDELEGIEAHWRERTDAERINRAAADLRLRSYNDVLDKIIRAGRGQSLVSTSGTGYYQGQPVTWDSGIGPVRKLGGRERLEAEVKAQAERIVNLESRLAAVVAVAEFAKEHKA